MKQRKQLTARCYLHVWWYFVFVSWRLFSFSFVYFSVFVFLHTGCPKKNFHTFSNSKSHSLSSIHNCRCEVSSIFDEAPIVVQNVLGMERAHLLNHKHLKMLSLKWWTHLRRTWLAPREATSWSYLIFVIFLHGQNFWRIKFTPKKRVNDDKMHRKLPIFFALLQQNTQ